MDDGDDRMVMRIGRMMILIIEMERISMMKIDRVIILMMKIATILMKIGRMILMIKIVRMMIE